MKIAQRRIKIRKARHARVRKKISGTPDRPRLCVRRSLNHVYAQLIDDVSGISLAQVSSLHKDLKEASGKPGKELAKDVGKKIGEVAKEKGIKTVVFDRGGYLFHGRIKSLADGAKETGLQF